MNDSIRVLKIAKLEVVTVAEEGGRYRFIGDHIEIFLAQ